MQYVCLSPASQIVRRINFYVDCAHGKKYTHKHTYKMLSSFMVWMNSCNLSSSWAKNVIRVLNFYFHVEIWEAQTISLDLFGNDVQHVRHCTVHCSRLRLSDVSCIIMCIHSKPTIYRYRYRKACALSKKTCLSVCSTFCGPKKREKERKKLNVSEQVIFDWKNVFLAQLHLAIWICCTTSTNWP